MIHQRYVEMPDPLMLAAMRDDLSRLTEADRNALSHWLGERLGAELPRQGARPLQVFHVVREAVEDRGVCRHESGDAQE